VTGWRATAGGLVLGLTLLGFGLRASGVSYGLPEIYHPDVPKQLSHVPSFLAGRWIPGTVYPMLHMYVTALLLEGRLLLDPRAPSPAEVAVAARLVSALFATAVIPLLFLIGRWLFDVRIGLGAAALATFSSLHVVHAHYEMGDAAHVGFVVASLAAAVAFHRHRRRGAFALAAMFAGLAGATKMYGALVLGALLVATLTGAPRAGGRRLALALLAAAIALATFCLATPKILVDPRAFLGEALAYGGPMGHPRLPPLVERVPLAARTLLGLSLDWLGAGILAAAVAGAAVLLWTAPARAALLLATPALTLALYVAIRPNYLDDRNLVILAPFVYLLTAVALGWIASRSRALAALALVAGLAIAAPAALDALHAAHLFREEETREVAARWRQTYLPPTTRIVTDRYPATEADVPRSDGDVLLFDSQDYLRHVDWYSVRRDDRARRALEFFAARGKLLKRFELLPRAFTAHTLSYYDLASMAVPYTFPPPADVPRAGTRVFVDPEAVPDPAAALVQRRRSRTLTVVSPGPLPRLAVGLSGEGRARVRHGREDIALDLVPGTIRVVPLAPRRVFPWYRYFYPITVEAGDANWVLARVLVTPCDIAAAHLISGRWDEAAEELTACRGTRWIEPARLLDLAWTQARRGQPALARAALDDLERAAPGLLGAFEALLREPDGPAWRERYRILAGHGPWFWHGHVFRAGDAAMPARFESSGADPGLLLLARPESGPAHLKVWFAQDFLRGPYRVLFQLAGAGDGPPVARLDVVRHFQHRVVDVAVTREYVPAGGGAPEEIALPVHLDLEPGRLEARVVYAGRGTVEVREVSVIPDVRAALRARLDDLAPLLAGRGATSR
jgi:hypothetical protein